MPRSRKAGSRPGFKVHCAETDLFRQTEPFELGGATDHQTAKLGIFAGAARTKIGNPATLVRDIAERAIQTGPTLGVDLLLQPSADLQLAARPQF